MTQTTTDWTRILPFTNHPMTYNFVMDSNIITLKQHIRERLKIYWARTAGGINEHTINYIYTVSSLKAVRHRYIGGAVAQSLECVTPGKALWAPAPYWLGRCQYNVTGWDMSHMVSPLCLVCGSTKKSPDVSLGARQRYSLVVDVDVKRSKTNKHRYILFVFMVCLVCFPPVVRAYLGPTQSTT